MNEDAIDRKLVCAFIAGLISDDGERKKALQYINELPPVTPQPKTGHWIKTPHGFKCSRCLIVHSHPSIFCPSCGARMVEPQERSE